MLPRRSCWAWPGYFRGWVDDVIQYLYTDAELDPRRPADRGRGADDAGIHEQQPGPVRHSLTERADMRLLFLCLILGVTSWTGLCRLLRGEALKLRELDYVAGRARLRRVVTSASFAAMICPT
jgi:peptide/nickel transport system permease protein